MATAPSPTYRVAAGASVNAGRWPGGRSTGGFTLDDVTWSGDAEGVITGFAGGVSTGTLVGDVWTPARTDGIVNAASWAIVPTGRWVSVSGTAIEDLQTVIDAAIPGWSSFAPNSYWDSWVGSWSGIGTDPDGARLWMFGGGHTNGSNNGLYRFDGYKMSWAIQKMPSDPATWSVAYKTDEALYNATKYQDSSDTYDAQETAGTVVATDGMYYDEDGGPLPTARHTYESLVYVPESDELLMMCRRLWRFNLGTSEWSQKRLMMDYVTARGAAIWPPGYMDNENIITVYDEVAGQLRASSNGSDYGGSGRHLRYNTLTNDWISGTQAVGSYTGSDSSPWQQSAQCSARNGRTVYFFQVPYANDPATTNGRDGWYASYDLDTDTFTQSATDPSVGPGFQYGGGLSRASFKNLSGDANSMGAVYVPSLNHFWLVCWNASSVSTLFEIDPTTTPWTISPGPTTGDAPPFVSKSTRNMMFVPDMNAIVCLPSGTADMRIYKF